MVLNRNTNLPYLSVGELKKLIKDLPDDIPVAYQRIEDVYFHELGWDTEKLKWGYPNLIGRDENGNKIYEPNISEYVIAFDAYKHPDEEIFVINAHY